MGAGPQQLLPDDSFAILPKDFQDAVRLVQSQLRQRQTEVDNRTSALTSEAASRRAVALALKVVTVLSGIVIATGFLQDRVVQVIGGIVPAVVALERIFANLPRLLAVTAAKNAYQRIRRQLQAKHDAQIIEVVRIRDRKPEEAANALITFAGALRDLLAASSDDIEARLEQNDYDALGTLSLEDHAAKGAPIP